MHEYLEYWAHRPRFIKVLKHLPNFRYVSNPIDLDTRYALNAAKSPPEPFLIHCLPYKDMPGKVSEKK